MGSITMIRFLLFASAAARAVADLHALAPVTREEHRPAVKRSAERAAKASRLVRTGRPPLARGGARSWAPDSGPHGRWLDLALLVLLAFVVLICPARPTARSQNRRGPAAPEKGVAPSRPHLPAGGTPGPTSRPYLQAMDVG